MMPESDATSSSPPPPPASFRFKWDVFLSFRGTDTRHTFTNDLYNALHARGVRVFRDDDGLGRGDEINASLLEAIDDSAASVIVLSEDYASSRWCLEELAKICDCGRLILPVFYRVDPSDVRKQKGPFEGSFMSHAVRFEAEPEKVQLWRDAMAKVGGIAGWVCHENSDSDKLIRVLVETVMKQMKNTPLSVAQYTVGVDDKVEELKKLLDVKINDVRVLGLYGMGGIGKTTLAKSLFNNLVVHFERRSFISNVRSEVNSRHGDDGGLVSLQNRVLGDLSSSGTGDPFNDVNGGVSAIKRALNGSKVLLILDDVDEVKQLDFLMGNREWFHNGSRVVITTRDRQVLPESYVDMFYEVRELGFSPAMELFCHHAMGRKEPGKDFSNLSKQIVEITGGLPLSLEVIGSFLSDKKNNKEWEDAVKKLKQNPHPGVQDVLKISYDALDKQEQCIFLDIACLFVQMEMERDDMVDILNGCNFDGGIAMSGLAAKCLIKITTRNEVWMHDQVRDMGRQIVQNESLTDYGLRSRLWDRDQILTVLMSNKGTRSIQGIVLDCVERNRANPRYRYAAEITWDHFHQNPSCKSALAFIKEKYKKYMQDREEKAKEVVLQTDHFQPMVSLRLLQINYSRMEGQFRCLPPGLKWLQWKQCPLRNLPSDYNPLELAVIDLSESNIETLWGRRSNKVAKNLMILKLSKCHKLAVIPDLTGYLCLRKIVLEECSHLTRIHESLGNLSTLVHLNLHRCKELIELPVDVSGLKHLEDLILSGCRKLKALPISIRCMVSLRQLVLDETAITELPESIFHLTKLEKLSSNSCQLKRLPTCIGKLCSLEELSLNRNEALAELPDSVGCLENLELLSLVGCKSLTVIPNSVEKLILLKRLHLNVSGIEELPDSIGSLSYLRELSVGGCISLRKLPVSIEALVCIAELQLDGTPITNLPEQIVGMKMLKKLVLINCKHLRFLPPLIGLMSALTTLDMYNTNITELPESIGMLENLTWLRLDMCRQLHRLPASMGDLKSLLWLLMKGTAVTHLPDSFGMLSSLVELQMERRPYLNNMPTTEIIANEQEEPNSESILTSFCNLTKLEQLNFRGWRIIGKIPDDFEKISSLETLSLGHNNICELPASMTGLSYLKKLYLEDCRELMFLPPLPSSMEELNIANCTAVEYISDISNLDSLVEFNLTNCEKVKDIPGLEHLKSLRRLYMSGCIGCSLAVKRRFSKVLLKKLQILIMPGSSVPDWFSGESVVFSKQRNRELKGIICAGVLSFNKIPEAQRDKLQIVDVQGKVFNLTDNVCSATFRLQGVPRTNEQHIFLHRFGVHTNLVFVLKDRCKLHLTKRDPPIVEGLELKDCGVYLVFEGDDDYEGDEESLEVGQYSVSQKLAKFFNSTTAEDNPDPCAVVRD